MYKTTIQRDYSSHQKKLNEKIYKTLDFRNKTGYYSPTKHMMAKKEIEKKNNFRNSSKQKINSSISK